MLLEGIFLPLTTPFGRDGRLFGVKLESNVRRYSLAPAAGMLVLGDVGEGDGLSDEEARSVLSIAAGASAKEKVMVAAVGRESVHATLLLADAAQRCSYDALAVRAPAFAPDPGMQTELLTYFRAVADGASLPVVLHSGPGRPLGVSVVAELAEHPNVIGLLDEGLGPERIPAVKAATSQVSREVNVTPVFAAATGRMLRASQGEANLGGVAVLSAAAVRTRVKRVGFQVLSGSTAAMLESWHLGASGAVPRLGPVAPQACCEVWQAYKDGDAALAEEKQERLRAIAERLQGPIGIGRIKYGCDFNGYYGGGPRLPLLGLTAWEREVTERLLAGMRN